MSPILLAIAAAVAVMMGRPVLFVQRRLGLDGTEFELIKFRTMTMATSEDGTPLPEKDRRELARLLDELGACITAASEKQQEERQ